MDSPDRDWEREPASRLSKQQDDADALRAEVEKLRVTLAASERARLEDAADHGGDMMLCKAQVDAAKAEVERLRSAIKSALGWSAAWGHNHWDHTQQHGAGCERCLNQGIVRRNLEAAIGQE